MTEPQKPCPECQTVCPASARFCPGCGHTFGTQVTGQAPAGETSVVPPAAPYETPVVPSATQHESSLPPPTSYETPLPPPATSYETPLTPQQPAYPPQTPPAYPPQSPPAYPQSQPGYQTVPQTGKEKLVAGLLAILLGSLGIHMFYLGHTGWGIGYLLVTLLTCGFGAIVTSIAGLIQGIMYLTASDADFQQKYVIEKRLF